MATTDKGDTSAKLEPPPASLISTEWKYFAFLGIERLKGETGKWGKVPCREAMQMAFGGPLSLSWCSPFSGLSCKKSPPEHVSIPQGEIIDEDVIEIPLE